MTVSQPHFNSSNTIIVRLKIDKKSGLIAHDDKHEDKVMVNIPYAMKLLLQELQTMSIATRLVTDDPIQNVPVFKYLHQNVANYSNLRFVLLKCTL